MPLSSGCLLLVCGSPGCGKTLLAKNLVDGRVRERPEWRWIRIHFDDFYPQDKRALQGMDNPMTFDLKHARTEIRNCLNELLSVNFKGHRLKTDPLVAHSTESAESLARFISYVNGQEKLFDDIGRYVGDAEKLMFVLDDNMHLRSMRHEYFLVARKYNLGFAQVFLTCSVTVSLERNSRRPVPIPDSSVLAINRSMEYPKPSQHHWEDRHLIIENSKDDDSKLKQDCERVIELVEDAIRNPVPPAAEMDVELQSASRSANLESCVHQADNLLRRLVGGVIQDSPPELQRSVVAREANFIRKKLLEDIRCGVIMSTNMTWDCSSGDINHLRTVVTEVFQDSMSAYFKRRSL